MTIIFCKNDNNNNFRFNRFRNSTPELELKADIVPPFRDDIQLTVSEYRSKLYEIMSIAEKKRK